MQFCDFDAACAPNGVEKRAGTVWRKRRFCPQNRRMLWINARSNGFFASDLYKSFMAENKVRREFKFSVLVPAQSVFSGCGGRTRKCSLQGVIDCLIETRDGFVILDFKTDRIKKGGAVEKPKQYRPQLAAYARAVHEIYGRPVRLRAVLFPHRRYRMGVA